MEEKYAYIEEEILTPLNNVISGELTDTDEWFWKRLEHCVDVCYDRGHQMILQVSVHPIYKQFIFREECLFGRPNYWLLSFIQKLMARDTEFGHWMQYQDVKQMVDIWANYAKKNEGSGWTFTNILSYTLSSEYEGDWEDLMSFLKERILREELEGNPWVLEIYCIFHAFVVIGSSGRSLEEKVELFRLCKDHWKILRFLYSVMLKRVVGCGYINFLQINNQVKNYTDYHPYLHLYYPAAMANKDVICRRGTNREKLEKSLEDIRLLIGNVTPSDDLDELCTILFPKNLKQYLEKYRLKSYQELENELHILQDRLEKNADEMRVLINKQAEMLCEDLSLEVISGELDKLADRAPGMAYEVFEKLNTLFVGNEVWTKNAEDIRNRILDKMIPKPVIHAKNVFEAGSSCYDTSKNITITNDKKQLK